MVEVWQIHDPPDTFEFEKIHKKKNKKSVLKDEDTAADKVIANLNGHNFHEDADQQHVPPTRDGYLKTTNNVQIFI